MPIAVLTPAFVKKATCPPTKDKVEFFDFKQPGFILEVRASGSRTFYQRYTNDHGKKRQYRIGPAGLLSPNQARQKAKAVYAQALLGQDPQARRQEERSIPTFAALVRDHYLPHAQRTKRSWKTDETVLRKHILPALGAKPIDTITAEQITALTHRIHTKGYAAGTVNRVIILIRHIFNLARRWKVLGATENPTADLALAPTHHRERCLTLEELPVLLNAIHVDRNQVAAKAILLLLLTGARCDDLIYARWEFIDWQRRTLFVPPLRFRKPRLICLNEHAIALLRSIKRLPGNPFVFASPVTGFPSPSLHSPWIRIRNRAGLTDLRLSDLQHSSASLLVNNKVSLYVV